MARQRLAELCCHQINDDATAAAGEDEEEEDEEEEGDERGRFWRWCRDDSGMMLG